MDTGGKILNLLNTKPKSTILVLICLGWFTSLIIRWGNFDRAYPNIEASYHYLLTLKSMLGNPLRETLLLPVVSLPGELNHFIPWGATLPGIGGNYVYTSFPPGGWLPAYLFFKLTSVEPTLFTLFIYGSLLGLFSAIAIGVVMYSAVKSLTSKRQTGSIAILISFTVITCYLYAPEVLLSQGVLVWPHALSQLVWIIGIYFAFMFISNKSNNKHLLGLLIFIALYCSIEQSGYFAAVFLAILFTFLGVYKKSREYSSAGIALFFVSGIVGAVTFAHFSASTGASSLLKSLSIRFLARSTQTTEPLFVLFQDWLLGVITSIGPVVFVVFATSLVFVLLPRFRSYAPELPALQKRLLLLIFISLAPVTENFVFLQHSGQFSFDRLKWVIPLTFLSLMLFESVFPKLFWPKALLILSWSLAGIFSYQAQVWPSAFLWKPAEEQNQIAKNWLRETIGDNYACAVFSSNNQVRGYLNVFLDRGIYEGVGTANEAVALTASRQGCISVYVNTRPVLNEMPMITSITILSLDGKIIEDKTFNHVNTDWAISYGHLH